MHIFVSAPSRAESLVLDVDPSMRVEDLKRELERSEDIPVEQQRLSCHGRDLMCGRTLGQSGVQRDATVTVLLRLRGGAQLGKPIKGRSKFNKAPDSSNDKMLEEKMRRNLKFNEIKKRARKERQRIMEMMAIEKKNTRINQLKIQNQWRKIMRLAKLEQLRKDIEILSQSHERDVDRKDAILQMLDRDLEEAEEQYQTAHRSHLSSVDRLIDIHDARLLALENEFERDLSTLEDDFGKERAEIVAKHDQSCAELHNVMAALEAELAMKEEEAQQEHDAMREEIRNRNLEEINMLRITLDSQIEDLEQHFEQAHLNYLQSTDKRTSEFKELTEKDHQLSEEIRQKSRKGERLQDSILQWRTKITQNQREAAERNSRLQAEKEQIQRHFKQLKSRLNRFRGSQTKRLAELAQTVGETRSKLEAHDRLGCSILRQAELARQLETEQEKVLPFYVSTVAVEAGDAEEEGLGAEAAAERKQKAAEAVEAANPTQGGMSLDEWNYLNNFWKRYNKATLDNLAIQQEKQRLEKENQDLQSILKQYIDGISVNESVMEGVNPLLVLNGRINLNQPKVEPAPGEEEHITVVDANHMLETGRAGK